MFPKAEVCVDVNSCSDHTPLTLNLMGKRLEGHGYGHFRYEAKWAFDTGYDEVVQQAWVKPADGTWGPIGANLVRCQLELKRWQQRSYGNGQGDIKKLQQRLCLLQGREEVGVGDEFKKAQTELQLLLDKNDIQWRQRAKLDWLKGGDRNTKYYHACANLRRKSNLILSINDEEGKRCESGQEVEAAFIQYFSGLFSSDSAGDLTQSLQPLETRVSNDMNTELLKPFTGEEIYQALLHMAPLKAPGPDCFPAGFFQKNWGTMGEDIFQALLGILNSGNMPLSLNLTNIVLIPKVREPMYVCDFRPISLCNVLYKMIFKVLANRLKKILHEIISPA